MSDYRQQQESEEEELWIIEMEAKIAELVAKEPLTYTIGE